ncbi:MAG TPA: hypothetical protein PK176_13860 [Acidobacteriota bacterium]|nr:hypothetical protein [Acidobacteriota bacterium]HQM64391.1 hypothetical protein [Acidobacteriota bacterium]
MNAETFGCNRCWPPWASAAWEAFLALSVEAELVDESHFAVAIRACAACGQRFVIVFTELIDWADGEDPQDWTVLPITAAEAAALVKAGAAIVPALAALAPRRRSLRREFPKGRRPRAHWDSGISVGPHD